MRQRFFLILSTSGGAGHLRAAEALEQACRTSRYPIRARHFDCLDFTSKTFKKIYAGSYLALVNRVPEVWGYFYQKAEARPYEKKGLLELFDHLNYRRYLKSLRAMKPDAVICTHFLPIISVSNEIRKTGFSAPFFASTTDFDVHQYWVDSLVERYYVYHEESAWQLKSKGVAEENIRVKGIPLMPEFGDRLSHRAARSKLRIDGKRFTVLVLSGGFGVGRVEQIVEQIAETLGSYRRRFSLLVVCGKNERARSNLGRRAFPANVDARIFGFVRNVHDLMDASDILVSKSGGLTSAEAMAKELPMVIIDPIPGQETRNSDLMVEHGAAWRAVNLPNLDYKLRRAIEQPALLTRARASARKIAMPQASQEILEDVYRYLEHRRTP